MTWTVLPDRLPSEGADASEQRSLIGEPGPWFLLSEPTSLLREVGDMTASTIRAASGSVPLIGAKAVEDGVFVVPPSGSAPEFYVLGTAAASKRSVAGLDVTYVADRPLLVERYGLEQLHARALAYLGQVVQGQQLADPAQRSLLVIWLGVTADKGRAGGAAGNDSFVANYIIDPGADGIPDAAMTLAIIAHEQFHQLAGSVRDDLDSMPVWISESLAHYYGLKALSVAVGSEAASAVVRRFIDPRRKVDVGLLELNRQYGSGDQAVYGLFYSQGATFWQAVDLAIEAATSGRESLDNYVTELLRTPMPDSASLPQSFIDKLREMIGRDIEDVLSTYL